MAAPLIVSFSTQIDGVARLVEIAPTGPLIDGVPPSGDGDEQELLVMLHAAVTAGLVAPTAAREAWRGARQRRDGYWGVTPPGPTLALWALHPSAFQRQRVAACPDTPLVALGSLARDPDREVRLAVAANPGSGPHEVAAAANLPTQPSSLGEAIREAWSAGLASAVLHPGASEDLVGSVLRALLGRAGDDAARLAADRLIAHSAAPLALVLGCARSDNHSTAALAALRRRKLATWDFEEPAIEGPVVGRHPIPPPPWTDTERAALHGFFLPLHSRAGAGVVFTVDGQEAAYAVNHGPGWWAGRVHPWAEQRTGGVAGAGPWRVADGGGATVVVTSFAGWSEVIVPLCASLGALGDATMVLRRPPRSSGPNTTLVDGMEFLRAGRGDGRAVHLVMRRPAGGWMPNTLCLKLGWHRATRAAEEALMENDRLPWYAAEPRSGLICRPCTRNLCEVLLRRLGIPGAEPIGANSLGPYIWKALATVCPAPPSEKP